MFRVNCVQDTGIQVSAYARIHYVCVWLTGTCSRCPAVMLNNAHNANDANNAHDCHLGLHSLPLAVRVKSNAHSKQLSL